MNIWKTQKTTLTPVDIEGYIKKHRAELVPRYETLYEYSKGKNTAILSRPEGDPNNPDNRTPVPYGRKIITTYAGYAFRPGYTTYKADDDKYAPYLEQLQATFDLSDEHIRTARAGRNYAIYGVAYELLYIEEETITRLAEPRFISVDPREIILLYDYSPKPKKQIGIRYYPIDPKLYKVEVYYPERIELYDRVKSNEYQSDGEQWKLTPTGTAPNFYDTPPIVAYYFGDDGMGVIEPVVPLIDDYDIIASDSINEFERFAHAYMRMVKMGLVPPELKKEPGAVSTVLRRLRQLRVFENLPEKDAVTFLTKDIPKDFIEWMTTTLREQIHEQSHVPDFANQKVGQLSGSAIERLLFDFENLVSSAEADFDSGLFDRISMINTIYRKAGRLQDESAAVVISHKRNLPLNLNDFADTALKMKQASFSRYLIADIMPDDVVPNVEEELERQEEDQKALIPDIEAMYTEPPRMGAEEPTEE